MELGLLKVNFVYYTKIFLILVGLAFLPNCSPKVEQSSEVPHKVDGALDGIAIAMQQQFNENGIRVITMGQNYLVSIPSNMLFYEESPRIRWNSYALLNKIVCYLQEFRKVSVNVAAFSSKCVSSKRERALTLARARAVSKYLWSQDIDSRFVFAQGLGSERPVDLDNCDGDNSSNSRIEITFKDEVK